MSPNHGWMGLDIRCFVFCHQCQPHGKLGLSCISAKGGPLDTPGFRRHVLALCEILAQAGLGCTRCDT